MKTSHPHWSRLVAVLAGFVLGVSAFAQSPAPAPRATAEYPNAEKYRDFRDSFLDTDRGREHLMTQITEHLVDLSRRYLPEGQRLEVRFADIDLAGEYEPWRGPNFDDIRIVKDIYPPRMEFDFRVVDANGQVVQEGHRKLGSLGFMMSNALALRTDDPLRHDKELLTDWMRREFRRARG